MDAGPDALRTSALANEAPLGAVPAGAADLGPISPELALVDPELARRLRQLLPEPAERPRPNRPAPAVEQQAATELLPEPEIEPVRRRRWARTAVLAVLIFAAGAASGTVLSPRYATAPSATLEVRALAPTTQSPPKPLARDKPAGLRSQGVSRRRRRTSTRSAPGRLARVVWASNVLGVATRASGRDVALAWKAPVDSVGVLLLRSRGNGPGVVVYRGRAASYDDGPLRSCTTYRYTMVNYDQRGHRSTGVPTSVVTGGCT